MPPGGIQKKKVEESCDLGKSPHPILLEKWVWKIPPQRYQGKLLLHSHIGLSWDGGYPCLMVVLEGPGAPMGSGVSLSTEGLPVHTALWRQTEPLPLGDERAGGVEEGVHGQECGGHHPR